MSDCIGKHSPWESCSDCERYDDRLTLPLPRAQALDVERLARAIDAAWPVLHSALSRGDIGHAEAVAAEYERLSEPPA